MIWTTTPWTIPGNRAISFSSKIDYGLYEVTAAPEGNWAKVGDKFILADKLAAERDEGRRRSRRSRSVRAVSARRARRVRLRPSARAAAATTSTSPSSTAITSPTTTAPASCTPRPATAARTSTSGWRTRRSCEQRGIDTTIPFTVDADGVFTKDAPGFEGKRVIDDKGDKGDANDAVIKALVEAGALIARGRLKHQYPHSWRSKKPVIFRNTPQWFIAMDKPLDRPCRASPPRGGGTGGADRRRCAWLPPP